MISLYLAYLNQQNKFKRLDYSLNIKSEFLKCILSGKRKVDGESK